MLDLVVADVRKHGGLVRGHVRIRAVDDHRVEGRLELLEGIGVVEDADIPLAEIGGERGRNAEVGKHCAATARPVAAPVHFSM